VINISGAKLEIRLVKMKFYRVDDYNKRKSHFDFAQSDNWINSQNKKALQKRRAC